MVSDTARRFYAALLISFTSPAGSIQRLSWLRHCPPLGYNRALPARANARA